MYDNLVKFIIENGGKIENIVIPYNITNGTGLCNPSLLYNDEKLYLNLRHVEYTLFCSEGNPPLYSTYEGPISYYHEDKDLNLRTNNFFCEIDKETLELKSFRKIDTSSLDTEPKWNFIGLEDARLIFWDNIYYVCGVRRDTNPTGIGRMELCEIDIVSDKNKVIEKSRNRIEVKDINSYCEKNWMPIKDMPFHFIKWTNPTEIVKINLQEKFADQVMLSDKYEPLEFDLRGGSQLVKWKDKYISIVHECKFIPKNINNYKDAYYYHRFVVWNEDFSINKISDTFTFMTGKIEFCIGLEIIDNDVYIAYSFQDNLSYIVKCKTSLLDNILEML